MMFQGLAAVVFSVGILALAVVVWRRPDTLEQRYGGLFWVARRRLGAVALVIIGIGGVVGGLRILLGE
jgi:hypothetical protein